jgi:hypothetical protein
LPSIALIAPHSSSSWSGARDHVMALVVVDLVPLHIMKEIIALIFDIVLLILWRSALRILLGKLKARRKGTSQKF